MPRRNSLLAILVACCCAQGARGGGPNIVLIVSDDAGYADFGFMNQFTGQTTQFKTPRLDDLARESVVFSNAYVSGTLCSFSRAGLLTGRYAQRFGVEWNFAETNLPHDGVPVDQVLISERMHQLGYATGMVGKWHQGVSAQFAPWNQGFDEFYGMLQGSRQYFHDPLTPPILRQSTPIAWQNEASFNQVPNDPQSGRLLTDAFGDEASRFIATHADDDNPFFLYVPFTAPHAPNWRWKSSDLEQFAGSDLTPERKGIASLAYGLDRNVGAILDRIDDPNQDGDRSDSIRNNTIVVFTNDNGGASPAETGVPYFDNGPLRDYKGSAWEGGSRVPMMIRAPGVDPRVVTDMVSLLDLFPTFVNAAGAAQTTPTDGVNLMPYLRGEQTGAVHDALFWRMRVDNFAVRKGDWKLVKGNSNSTVQLHRLNPDGSGETVDLTSQFPEKVQELIREFVHWEATVDKLRNTGFSSHAVNNFDEFKQRNDVSTAFNWRWTQGWAKADNPSLATTLQRIDAAPNTVLIFEARNDASYTSWNNVTRAVGHTPEIGVPTPAGLYEFMLNEVRLQGDFNAAAERSGTLFGNPLMFVTSLTGRTARLSLDANKTGASPNFTFNVDMDLILHDNLMMTGNGTGRFNVNGVIRDFDHPRGVIKEGTSEVRLTAHNTFGGELVVNDGIVHIDGSNAWIDGASRVAASGAGVVKLTGGRIHTAAVDLAGGGQFQFDAGTVELTGDGSNFGPSTLTLGSAGPATLQLAAGASAQTAGLRVGLVFDGALTVNSGAVLTTQGAVEIAPNNTGTPGSQATVDGDGATWTIAGPLVVGQHGIGRLAIQHGGRVQSGNAQLGAEVGGSGTATVGGAGDTSTWTATSMHVGGAAAGGGGAGSLTIDPNGFVDVEGAFHIWNSGVVNLAGGEMRVGTFSNAHGGAFNWQSGTVTLTNGDGLALAADGPLGALVTLNAYQTLEVFNSTSIASGCSLTLDGGTLRTATLERNPAGQFQWLTGTLRLTGPQGLTIDGAGSLGSTVALETGDLLIVDGTTTVGAGGSLSVTDGSLATGRLHLAGGDVTTPTLAGIAQVALDSGRLAVNGPSGIAIGEGGPFIDGTVTLGPDDELFVAATTRLTTGGSLSVNDGVFTTGKLELAGGAFRAQNLSGIAVVDFQAGMLAIAGDLDIGPSGSLGPVVHLANGDTLEIGGATTVEPDGTLTLAGGSLTTAELINAGGTIDWQSGAIAITGQQGLTLTGGPLGDVITIGSGKSLNVAATTVIGTGSALTVSAGGAFSSGVVEIAGGLLETDDVATIGAINFTSGALHLTGAGISIGPGQVISSLTLDAGKSLNATQLVSVESGGALAVTDGAFSAQTLKVNGGQFTASSFSGIAAVEVVGGSILLTGPGEVVVGPNSVMGPQVILTPGASLHVADTVTITADGELSVPGGDFTTGALKLNGGTYRAHDLAGAESLEFNLGTLAFTGDLTVDASSALAEALGDAMVIGPGRRLSAAGTATLATPLRLGGGRLTVGGLINRELLNFDAGVLDLTATDLIVGDDGMWGPVQLVRTGTVLNIGGATVVNPASLLEIQAEAKLSSASLLNNGEIKLNGSTATVDATVALQNWGILHGAGRVGGPVSNESAGRIEVGGGERLRFLGQTFENQGTVLALGSAASAAELAFAGLVANASGAGLISGADARMTFEGGVANHGSIALTGGQNHVLGDIDNTGNLVVTGGASATFYDDVANNGVIRVSASGSTSSVAVFLGSVTGAGGTDGGGDIFFEGDLRPDSGPTGVVLNNNVNFGLSSLIDLQIAGLTPGVDFDQLVIGGRLTLGGELDVELLEDFLPQAGQSFHLISAAGGISGAFASVELPTLADSLSWRLDVTANDMTLRVLGPAINTGDFDADGDADGADFLTWQRYFGQTTGAHRSQGDGNGDGAVDALDLAIWTSVVGAVQAAPAASSIPEPANATLVAIAVASRLTRRRPRCSRRR